MKNSFLLRILVLIVCFAASCTDHEIVPEPQKLVSADFAKNLVTPFGITKGAKDYLWVTEVGTGNNDGKVSLITPDGKIYTAIIGFTSDISEEEGLPDGLTHLTYKDGYLYIVQGIGGLLYKIKVSDFKPGDPPIQANHLEAEKIGDFVLKYAKETHLYNLTWGPDGDLYFADAAANLIVKRKWNGELSIFTKFDQVANPKAPLGPPTTDFVPTGIAFDGSKFLVSSLTGFPFNDGQAIIQQVDLGGKNSKYKGNFTLLTDIVLTPSNKPLVLQFGTFAPAPPNPGFQPLKGKVLDENGTVLIDGLTMPTDIERTGDKTYYIVSMAEGKIIKLTY